MGVSVVSEFLISYDGFIADEHQLDMRRLGYALVGLDHIVSTGLIGLTEFRFPKGRERLDLTVVAEPPREGSVEIVGSLMPAYQALQPAFPFLLDLIKAKAPDLVWDWLSATFKWLGGRKIEAEPHIEKCVEFMRDAHEAVINDRKDERKFIIELIESVRFNAKQVAMPVGNSSRRLLIKSENGEDPTEIDAAVAAVIRSKDDLEISGIQEINVRIDGISKHSGRASIEFVEDPEHYHYAEIKDPAVYAHGNAYVQALDSGRPIIVFARMTYKGGEIHRVYILATKEGDDPFSRAA